MTNYLEPTQESGKQLFLRQIEGEVVMLNLLRFREIADYSAAPELAPAEPISGREAYDKYMAHTAPYLREHGGRLIFMGDGGHNFIGPTDERWDVVLLVQQKSIADFMAFAQNEGYMAGIGHRTAALEDSRLLPIIQQQ